LAVTVTHLDGHQHHVLPAFVARLPLAALWHPFRPATAKTAGRFMLADAPVGPNRPLTARVVSGA
jgi:hypothetical protein